MNNLLFLKLTRQQHVTNLYRNIIKALQKFKQFDIFIYDYMRLYIRNEFRKNIGQYKLSTINILLEKGKLALSDIKRIEFEGYNGKAQFELVVFIH
jgi:hypothetical protein